jgi:hypothetical protein
MILLAVFLVFIHKQVLSCPLAAELLINKIKMQHFVVFMPGASAAILFTSLSPDRMKLG